jgi:hypothetical protein
VTVVLPAEPALDGARSAAAPLRVVELMHPDGEARAEAAIGARAARFGAAPRADSGRAPDLLWLAPGAGECRTRGWLADAAARVERELAADGIAYVLPPRGWRGAMAARLRRAGFRVEPPVAHLAGGGVERWLVPLRRGEVKLLLRSVLPLPAAMRRLAAAAARAPGWSRVAAEAWPTVGFVARRPGSRAPWSWLGAIGGEGVGPDGVVAVRGWRGADDSVLLHLLAAGGEHAAVAKVARAGAAADEAEILARLGGAAEAAGARVPRVLGSGGAAGRRVTTLGVVPGRRAVEEVGSSEAGARRVLLRVAEWLEAWNRATVRTEPLGADELEREVLAPLRLLAPLLADGGAYAARVRSLCARVEGRPLPRVAAHGDLTLHNLLLDGATLGVVDWEAARADGWPLTDLEYAATDAAAAAGGYLDRPRAWAECFRPGGAFAAELAGRRARLADALGIPPPFAELCRHACWLHHAASEHRSAGEASGRPFLGVLRAVAGVR